MATAFVQEGIRGPRDREDETSAEPRLGASAQPAPTRSGGAASLLTWRIWVAYMSNEWAREEV